MMLEYGERGATTQLRQSHAFARSWARASSRRGRGLSLPMSQHQTPTTGEVPNVRPRGGTSTADLKYATRARATILEVPDTRARPRDALREMYRQTGDELVFAGDGTLRRGLVVRLLVLPNDVAGVRESLEWIRDELSPRVAVSLMAQYYATNRAATDERYVLLGRRITEGEWWRAVSLLERLGMEEGWMQEYDGASHYYRPDFTDPETPFKDIRDFQTQ